MKEGSAILYDTMESIEKIELFIALAGVAWVKAVSYTHLDSSVGRAKD